MNRFINMFGFLFGVFGLAVACHMSGKASCEKTHYCTKQGNNSVPQFCFYVSTNKTDNGNNNSNNNTQSNSVIYRNVFLTNNNGNYYGESNETCNWNGNIVYVHFSFSQRQRHGRGEAAYRGRSVGD